MLNIYTANPATVHPSVAKFHFSQGMVNTVIPIPFPLIDEIYYKLHELSVDRQICWLLGVPASAEDGLG